jgi:photosystem II stability/assembly factor-like uncharacterized protein
MAFSGLFAALALTVVPSPQRSDTTANLRGLRVVSPQVAWASGSQGTYLVTEDGGSHWRSGVVAGAEALDFRDVEAFDARTAYLLSSGPGAASRLYLTRDGGHSWKLLFTNPDPAGFLDALAFWDRLHGIILGDPVLGDPVGDGPSGHFAIFTTSDGGQDWTRQRTPAALPDEGAFAASGTCLMVKGTGDAWFGSGGPQAGRIFRSGDGGKSWDVNSTPLAGSTKSSGIFSLAFASRKEGLAVGGDYQKPDDRARTAAVTKDSGKTWQIPKAGHLGGYRSGAAATAKGLVLAVGTSGADFSMDEGQSWMPVAAPALNAVGSAGKLWLAVGPKGTIMKFNLQKGE